MPTVLIADDDGDHRELLTLALAKLGHTVVQAADADSALLALRSGGIDAALLDVRMPGTCGIELCQLLRADPATAHLPIMLVSADVNGTRILAAMDAGADDYLAKPYHRAELGSRVTKLLTRDGAPAHRPAVAAHAALLAARAAAPVPVPRPLRHIA
jgi:DNA-binding response OmpR family regulator